MVRHSVEVETRQSVAAGSVAGRKAPSRPRATWYVSVAAKFSASVVFALGWVAVSVWLSLPWLRDLSGYVGTWSAIAAVTLVAYIPALLMSFMAMSLLLDRQPPLRVSHPTAGVTIVIAARNEEAGIADTIRHAVE